MNEKEYKKAYTAAAKHWQRGDPEAALPVLLRLELEFPDRPDILYAKGLCLISVGRLEEATAVGHHLKSALQDKRGHELIEYATANKQIRGLEYAIHQASFPRIRTPLLVFVVLAACALVSAALFFLNRSGMGTPARTELAFEESSIGMLYQWRESADGPRWARLGEARGTIAIDSDAALRLVIGEGVRLGDGEQLDLSVLGSGSFSVLREVDASGVSLDDADVAYLVASGGPQRLDLDHCGITDAALTKLLQVLKLDELRLSNNPITDIGARWIGMIATLRSLDIRETGITDRGLKQIAQVRGITTLKLPYGITDTGVSYLTDLADLEELDLSRTGITDYGVGYLGDLRKLRRVNLGATRTGDEGLARLAALNNLESLDASYTLVTDSGLAPLGRLTALRTLILDGAPLGDDGLAQLAGLSHLVDLSLISHWGQPAITTAGLTHLGGIPSLAHLTLSDADAQYLAGASLADGIVVDFRESPVRGPEVYLPGDGSIGTLWFRPGAASEAEWQRLGPAQGRFRLRNDTVLGLDVAPDLADDWADLLLPVQDRLERVRFDGVSWAGGAGLGVLNRFPQLRELVVSSAEIHKEGLAPLSELTSLRVIRLHNVRLDAGGLDVLRGLDGLQGLDLAGSPVGDGDLEFLGDLPGLRHLGLRDTDVTNAVLPLLRQAAPLESIDLSGTAIDSDKVSELREAMPGARIVFPDADATTIAFPGDTSMGWVWLREGEAALGAPWRMAGPAKGSITVPPGDVVRLGTDEQGAERLGSVRGRGRDAVVSIALSGRGIHDEDLDAIARFPSVERLELSGTSITDQGLGRLSGLNQLRAIGLAYTSIGDQAVPTFGQFDALREIDLSQTEISDEGLAALVNLGELEAIYLDGSKVSPEGMRQARAALPTAYFSFYDHWTGRAPESQHGQPARALRIRGGKPVGTLWMRDQGSTGVTAWQPLGRPFFDTAIPAGKEVKIRLEPRDLIDVADLSEVGPRAVQTIEFAPGSRVCRSVLEAVTGWQDLNTIVCDLTTIENDAFSPLPEIRSLRSLHLHRARLNDVALAALRNVPWLEDIDLSGATVSDAAFAHVASVAGLHRLDTHGNTALSDLALSHLGRLRGIRELNLSRTGVSDAGMDVVGSMEKLETLHLFGTRVTMGRVEGLLALPALETIHRTQLALTDADISGLLNDLGTAGRGDPVPSQRELMDALALDTLADLTPEALDSLRLALLADVARSRGSIDKQTIARLASMGTPDGVAADDRPELVEAALRFLSYYTGAIDAADLAAIAGAPSLEALDAASRERLQGLAFSAHLSVHKRMTPDQVAAIAGVDTLEDLAEDARLRIEELVLAAMANSDAGITAERFASLAGPEALGLVGDARLAKLQKMALSAMADSETGITTEAMAGIAGSSSFAQIQEDALVELQGLALSAMADSDTGVTAAQLARIGGAERYEDLAADTKARLHRRALESMTRLEEGVSSRDLARLAGAEDLNRLPTAERTSLQAIALSTMATSDTGITEQGMADIGWLDSVKTFSDEERLSLRSKAVSELAGADVTLTPDLMKQVLGGDALKSLRLANSQMTDAEIPLLGNLRALRVLDISGNRDITDKTLARLARSSLLEILFLGETGISDDGLVELQPLVNLHSLDLSNTTISGRGLSVVPELSSLQRLTLASIPTLTDAAIDDIARSTTLTEVSLNATPIGDSSVEPLGTMAALKRLDIRGTNISPRGALELIARLPDCDILQDQVSEEIVHAAMEAPETPLRRLPLVPIVLVTIGVAAAVALVLTVRALRKHPERVDEFVERWKRSRRLGAKRWRERRATLKEEGIYYSIYTFKGGKALLQLLARWVPLAIGVVVALILFRVLSYALIEFIDASRAR